AFEPDPKTFVLLKRNCNNFERIHVNNFGLFNADVKKPLYRGKIDNVTASVGHSEHNTEAAEVVSVFEAHRIFRNSNFGLVDILKIDTEGCEIPILHSARDVISTAK